MVNVLKHEAWSFENTSQLPGQERKQKTFFLTSLGSHSPAEACAQELILCLY